MPVQQQDFEEFGLRDLRRELLTLLFKNTVEDDVIVVRHRRFGAPSVVYEGGWTSGLTTVTDPNSCPADRSSEYKTAAPEAWAA